MDMLNAQFTTYNEERRWLNEENRSYAQVTHSRQSNISRVTWRTPVRTGLGTPTQTPRDSDTNQCPHMARQHFDRDAWLVAAIPEV